MSERANPVQREPDAIAIPATGWLGAIARVLSRFIPPRFVKFCVVGFSGVLVNIAALWLLADLLNLHTNVSLALSIELSIVSNFLLNDRWTFADRSGEATPWPARIARFHVVSAVGAVVQALTFVIGNLALAALLDRAGSGAMVQAGILRAIVEPPEIGPWKYLAQVAGIGLAAAWNFAANLSWTWRRRPPAGD